MKKLLKVTAALALLSMSIAASSAITIDTVTVGNTGNAADTTSYGSVGYIYNIGKYEVTAGQYTTFLNAVAKMDTYGLYDTNMASTVIGSGISRSGIVGFYTYTVDTAFVNRPVNFLTFWDCCRFANWLGNGQLNGAQDATTTEDGAYTLNGYTGANGSAIKRNAGWTWAVTSENEWYKAAYYDPNKLGGPGYWQFPTQSNVAPGRDMADPFGNNSNYYGGSGTYPIDAGKYTTVAGEFQNSKSAYGTFDQGGNVLEWNESIINQDSVSAPRGLRGGTFNGIANHQKAITIFYAPPNSDYDSSGFRVTLVPEPSPIIVLSGGLAGLIRLRRCKS